MPVSSVKTISKSGSLTKTSLHAPSFGMAAAAATPIALKRNMNVYGRVASHVSPTLKPPMSLDSDLL